MMKKLRLTLIMAALTLLATVLLPSFAGAVTWTGPSRTFYASGSSAMFNALGIAAIVGNPGYANPACGANTGGWWTYKSTSTIGAAVHDIRGTGAPDEVGSVWVAWDSDFAAGLAGTNTSAQQGTICIYVSIDSTVGVREFMAYSTIAMNNSGGFPIPDGGIIPLVPTNGTGLPQNVFNYINGKTVNIGMTDIRPEDAFFASVRTLTPLATRIPRTSYTGVGYGTPHTKGTQIQDATASKFAQPVDFVLYGGGYNDPFNGAAPRPYSVYVVGADPELVTYNFTDTASGHLGDGNYTNINRYVLRDVLSGQDIHIRQMAAVSGEPDAPLNTFIREPLSGTYNTMEFCILQNEESWPTLLNLGPNGQETGVNPGNTANCGVGPCAAENGNPYVHIASNGAVRKRAVGTSNMVAAVNNNADSLGYSFWGYSNFSGKTNIKYMTVDGIDPLYSTASANPNGAGVFPACTSPGPCRVPFNNVVDGSYPIWSYLRMVYDNTDPTCYANGMIIYGNAVSDLVTGNYVDYVPLPYMRAFRSHFGQLIDDTVYNGQVPHNGITAAWPVEYGGDMGGAVLTVQSELDYAADNGGTAEQLNERQ